MEPCGAGQPCEQTPAPLWDFLEEVASPSAQGLAGPSPPRGIMPCLSAAEMEVVVPAAKGWEVTPVAAAASPA